jgi:hypothetical protein
VTDTIVVPRHAGLAGALALVLTTLLGLGAAAVPPAAASATPRYRFGQMVSYPLVFPAAEPHTLGSVTHFWDDRYLGIHHAQDIMADKMTPVYAVAEGTVTWIGTTCCTITLGHDDGWESHYLHLNNDHPGTDDGQGWGIAPGIVRGSRVERGQLIGWVGDSGNAEYTRPHLHFELWAPDEVAVDSFESLQEAEAAQGLTCAGEKATRTDTNGDHRIAGTPFADVIVGTDEADDITGGDGDDLICGRGGKDRLRGGEGDDHLLGGIGRDLLVASPGADLLEGGAGRDAVTFATAPAGVQVDLAAGTAAGGLTASLLTIEVIHGSPYRDHLTGDAVRNVILGRAGNDALRGAGGNDRLVGGEGDDTLRGGNGDDLLDGGPGDGDTAYGDEGTDTCMAEVADCEF